MWANREDDREFLVFSQEEERGGKDGEGKRED